MMIFTGDLYLGSNNITVHSNVLEILNNNKIIVSNFENVIRDTDNKAIRKDKNSILSISTNELSKYLSQVNSQLVMTLGNNHIHDLDDFGITNTVTTLEKYQIKTTGVGYINEVLKPLILEHDQKKIAILTVSSDNLEVMSIDASENRMGVLNFYKNPINALIKEFSQQVDYVIVQPHWGLEYINYPSPNLRRLAHSWIDSGADLIIGHHPHVIQGKEKYKGKSIYYSLGNYIFPSFSYTNGIIKNWSTDNNRSIMLQVDFSNNINIIEYGLLFDDKNKTLIMSKDSLESFKERSKYLDLTRVDIKKYYSIWEREYLNILLKRESLLNKIKKFFPQHKEYNRLEFFMKRFIKRMRK
jgi:poly-gamma-glutamate capsule biosynthesis protein CapA/YwtB (metallophosphatase superfamily)